MLIERALIRQRGARRPHGLQLASCLLRLPWLVGNDTNEVFPDDNLHDAREILDRAFVNGRERCAERRGPYDAPMKHSGHANVVRVLEPAGDDCGEVEPLYRLPKYGPLTRRLPLRGLVQLDVELLSTDQLAIANALRGVAARPDRSVNRDKALDGHAQPLGSKLEERFACGGPGEREIALIEVGRM